MSTDSGPLPGATEGEFRGAAAYFAMVNAAGGVCGRKITVLKGDDALELSTHAPSSSASSPRCWPSSATWPWPTAATSTS